MPAAAIGRYLLITAPFENLFPGGTTVNFGVRDELVTAQLCRSLWRGHAPFERNSLLNRDNISHLPEELARESCRGGPKVRGVRRERLQRPPSRRRRFAQGQ